MTTLFDSFLKKITAEGVEVDNTSSASALINASIKNADNDVKRQVHSQCSHTNFKDCKRVDDEALDKNILDKLAQNRAAIRAGSLR